MTRNLGKNYTLLILYLANLKIDILKSKVPLGEKALLILLCNYKNMKGKVSRNMLRLEKQDSCQESTEIGGTPSII